jgi:hypothetical protein
LRFSFSFLTNFAASRELTGEERPNGHDISKHHTIHQSSVSFLLLSTDTDAVHEKAGLVNSQAILCLFLETSHQIIWHEYVNLIG